MRTFSRLIRAHEVTDETYWSILHGGHWKLTHVEHRWSNPEGTGDYETVYFLSPSNGNSYAPPHVTDSFSLDMFYEKVEVENKS